MRAQQWISARAGRIILAVALTFSGTSVALSDEDSSSQVAAATQTKIEATIFAYDGQDFIRTQTTLVAVSGESAVDTKLDHDSPAYAALTQKHSYTGGVTLFGKKYDAKYAPLTDRDGRLIGALFVAVPMQ